MTTILLRRALRDSRTRTASFALLFGVLAYVQPIAYSHTYPTLADRIAFAHSFATNRAVDLFYGHAYDLLTVGGYSAWRVGGTLAIFAAIFGVFAATRALRAEEDAGRSEMVLSAAVSRTAWLTGALAAAGLSAVALAVAELVGLVLGGLPLGESAYLALATLTVTVVFAAIAALLNQLAASRRAALQLGFGIVALALLLRVIADTSSAGWVRWATPLGWAELLRPFTGAQPLVLLLPVGLTAILVPATVQLARGRDIGTGILAGSDRIPAHGRLLSSPTQLALRSDMGILVGWTVAIGAFAFVLGIVSRSVATAGIPRRLSDEVSKLGVGSIATARGYIGLVFFLFALALGAFAISQMLLARHEEEAERLETLLALPVGRGRWLSGRLGLTLAAAIAIALVAALLAWLGARVEGVSVPLVSMLEAGANCLTTAVLFGGIAVLTFALLPRGTAIVSYVLLTLAFLWQLTGQLLGAPAWVSNLTPFAHLGLAPGEPFRLAPVLVMAAAGTGAAALAIVGFRRRDLVGP